MLKKLQNTKGFTLIELMIVICIIGILAAIAISNFIHYRNKSFCTAAEHDANSIVTGLSDYFTIPTFTHIPPCANLTFFPLGRQGNVDAGVLLTGLNKATIIGTDPNEKIEINVVDTSSRCPQDYQRAMDKDHNPIGYWNQNNVYVKIMIPG